MHPRRSRLTDRIAIGLLAVTTLLAPLTGCASSGSPAASPSGTSTPATTTPATGSADASTGADRDVTLTVGGVTVAGSLRLPDGAGPFPAAVLLAGSGPTDRNGDTPLITGSIGTLRHLADVLARHGVASLRYDKLGSGKTGLGPFAADPSKIGFDVYVQEAAAALHTLAGSDRIDRAKLLVIGHSEGGLVALATAAGSIAPAPAPALVGVGLLEPLPVRYLDLIRLQLRPRIAELAAAGKLTEQEASDTLQRLDQAISTVRATGAFPTDTPTLLRQAGLSPANARFLQQADALDPARLASRLPATTSVLQTCSGKDIQVTCDQQQALRTALDAHGRHTWLRLENADHVLKNIGSQTSTGAEYGQDLPFDPALDAALASWLVAAASAH